jgi:hypothetical protein
LISGTADPCDDGHLRSVIDPSYTLEPVPETHRYVDTGQKPGNVVIMIKDLFLEAGGLSRKHRFDRNNPQDIWPGDRNMVAFRWVEIGNCQYLKTDAR